MPWCRRESMPAASRPSAMARRSRSAWNRTNPVGSRTAAVTLSTRGSTTLQGRKNLRPLFFPVAEQCCRAGIFPTHSARNPSKIGFRNLTPMTLRRFSAVLALLSTLWLTAAPAWGASKEMIQLQTQVQQLQEQMTAMQRSFDERMGVMKNLVEQDTDAINKVTGAINGLQATLQKQQGDSASHVDQLGGQLQSLNDTLDELKARLAKVSKQLEDMQSSQQSLAAKQSEQAQQDAAAKAAPPPDMLYNNALRDYN